MEVEKVHAMAAQFQKERDEANAHLNVLRDDVKHGLRAAYEFTLDTQTVESACVALVELLRTARAERDIAKAALEKAQAERDEARTDNSAHKRELEKVRPERDALAAEASLLRELLSEHTACLDDDGHGLDCSREIAALATPSRAAEWQKAREDCIRVEVGKAYAEKCALEIHRVLEGLSAPTLVEHDDRVRRVALEEAADLFAGPASLEAFSARAHDAYQTEAHRRGDVRHADAYDALPDATKEWDRVLCRWVSWELRALAARAPEQKSGVVPTAGALPTADRRSGHDSAPGVRR